MPTIELICGNCIDVIKNIKDCSIDLTVTSPPYDHNRTYGGYIKEFEEDVWKKILLELYRVTVVGGVVVWVVGDTVVKGSETGTSFKQALYAKDVGFRLHDTMIYEKTGISFSESVRYYQIFEYMFIFSKGRPKTINLIRDRKNLRFGDSLRSHKNKRTPDGDMVTIYINERYVSEVGVRTNIWRICSVRNANSGYVGDHPAIFPESLARDHVITWSNVGDVVLDPMMGSGTVGYMCKELSRDFIGIEINPEYYEIARKRINNEEKQ